ncbi:hypothetical protein QF018_001422 [Pseudomonas laurylsulfatiphila]
MLFKPMKKALHAIPGNTDNATPVGASLLAMDSSAPRLSSSYALSLTTIAGKPAPTGDRVRVVFSRNTCRSQPAGDGLQCAAFIQLTRVIVNDHRWQASSHKGPHPRRFSCNRSQPAGDGLKRTAFIQITRVIVNDHRWQASSYRGPRLSGSYALSLTTIAGRPAPTRARAHAETPKKRATRRSPVFYIRNFQYNQ